MGHNILVTGGAGYLGSILIPELLRTGNKVTVLDNFIYKQNSLAHVCNNSNFQIIRGDVRLKNTLLPLLDGVEIIIPLAALVGAPLCDRDPINAKTINHDSMLALFEWAQNEQYILMPTTNSAYGTGGKNMVYGPFMQHGVAYGAIKDKNAEYIANVTEKGISVDLPGNAVICYDAHRLSVSGLWQGKLANTDNTHHTSYKGERCLTPGDTPSHTNIDAIGWVDHSPARNQNIHSFPSSGPL